MFSSGLHILGVCHDHVMLSWLFVPHHLLLWHDAHLHLDQMFPKALCKARWLAWLHDAMVAIGTVVWGAAEDCTVLLWLCSVVSCTLSTSI